VPRKSTGKRKKHPSKQDQDQRLASRKEGGWQNSNGFQGLELAKDQGIKTGAPDFPPKYHCLQKDNQMATRGVVSMRMGEKKNYGWIWAVKHYRNLDLSAYEKDGPNWTQKMKIRPRFRRKGKKTGQPNPVRTSILADRGGSSVQAVAAASLRGTTGEENRRFQSIAKKFLIEGRKKAYKSLREEENNNNTEGKKEKNG